MELITDNPILSSAVAALITAAIAFIKPIAKAVQRALIRRIEQAWPDDACATMTHEEKIKRTVDIVNSGTVLPRSMVEKTVRTHKSNPPPAS